MKAHPKIRNFAKANRRNLTHAETILWSKLRRKQLGWQFRRQHPVGHYIADFACTKPKLIVEVDGATHATDTELAYDERRSAYLIDQGWTVHRVGNHDIYDNLDGVVDGIIALLPPSAGHLPRERGKGA